MVLVAGGIHYFSEGLFWRLAAYLAVFHFIRQQYGFLKLYTRAEGIKQLDVWMIYSVTVFPMLYWHLSEPRNFMWFTAKDFLFYTSQDLADLLKYTFWVWVAIYYILVVKEYLKTRKINLPKTLLILSRHCLFQWRYGVYDAQCRGSRRAVHGLSLCC